MPRRIFTFLLATLFVLSTVACASGKEGSDDSSTPPPDTSTEVPETEYQLTVTSANYGNAEWNVLTRARTAAGGMYHYIDIAWQEDLEGDVYNDALYARNIKIEEDFQVVISVTENNDTMSTITNLVASDDTTYSTVSPKMNEGLTLGQEGVVYDLCTLDALQLDAPWWDEALFRDLSMGSKMFMITGDASVMDEEMLYVIFCNKKLIKDNNMEDPYEIVRDGRWTLDKLHELSNGVNNDVDGNGIFDEKDMYGFGSDFSTAPLLFYAAGGSIAELDTNGAPYLTLNSEKNEAIIERIAAFHNDSSSVANATQLPNQWKDLSKMLMEDRLLFRQGNVYNIPGYREMISDFGILPLPKYTEEQENYRHVVATSYATGFTIPANLSGEALERSCVVLTALSANSQNAVNAYYEVNLKFKNARDEASADMLEIIFNSKCYELGKVFDWGRLETNVVQAVIRKPGTFASQYEANKTAAETQMQESYNRFK